MSNRVDIREGWGNFTRKNTYVLALIIFIITTAAYLFLQPNAFEMIKLLGYTEYMNFADNTKNACATDLSLFCDASKMKLFEDLQKYKNDRINHWKKIYNNYTKGESGPWKN